MTGDENKLGELKLEQERENKKRASESLHENRLKFLRRMTIEKEIRGLNSSHVRAMGKTDNIQLASETDETEFLTESDITEEDS